MAIKDRREGGKVSLLDRPVVGQLAISTNMVGWIAATGEICRLGS